MSERCSCYLCGQIVGDRSRDLISVLSGSGEYTRRVVAETNNFAVIPSLGPLAGGHLLICPRAHVSSSLQATRADGIELKVLKRKLVGVLEDAYSQPVHVFEHGVSESSDRVLCSVEHAHIHLLPAAVSGSQVLRASGLEWERVTGRLEEELESLEWSDFLSYESPDHDEYLVINKTDRIESQHMRRVFAKLLGCWERWNWRKVPDPEACDSIFRDCRSVLGENRPQHEHGFEAFSRV